MSNIMLLNSKNEGSCEIEHSWVFLCLKACMLKEQNKDLIVQGCYPIHTSLE